MAKDEREQFESGQSLIRETLRSLTGVTMRHPKTSLCVMLVLACLATGYTLGWMKFKTDRADLIDPSAPFQQRWQAYADTFGDTSEVTVAIEAEDPDNIKAALEDLGGRLNREPELFRNVLYKVEPGALRSKGLQYLSQAQLQEGLQRIEEYQPIIRGRWDLVKFDSVVRRLTYQIQSRQQHGQDVEPLLHHTKVLANSMARFVSDPDDFTNPWPPVVPIDPRLRESAQEVVYLMNDSGRIGFLKCFPVQHEQDFNGATASIDRLREIMGEVQADHSTVSLGLTGIPILENDEMRESQNDMLLASVVSVIGVGLVLLIGFRGIRHPVLAMVMLAIAMAWSFGFTTLSIGHLNILSVSFAAILIGLGIDFSIHYLARYLELRHEQKALQPALLETSGSVGVGIVTAAVTTALAFFCASFTQFLGVAELGIIAGGGILLCALATFLVLPALIALSDDNLEPKKLPAPFEGKLLKSVTARFPWLVLLLSIATVGGVGVFAMQYQNGKVSPRIKYDSNLLNLQAEGLESVELQKRIFQDAQHSLLFAVSVADSPREAQELKRKFEQLPTVHHVEELGSRIPETPSNETQLLVQAFGAQLARLPARPPELAATTPGEAGRTVEQLYTLLKSMPGPKAAAIRQTLDRFLDDFDRLSATNQQSFLNAFQYRMQTALLRQFQALAHASNSDPVVMADLPDELTSRFVSEQGKWLVQIYPQNQIWDVEPLRKFVQDVRSVDPNVTGTPLQNYEASQQIKQSYQQAAIYALAIIAIVLLLDFLDGRFKLVSILPPVILVVVLGVILDRRQIDINPGWLAATAIVMIVMIAGILDYRNCRDALLALFPPLCGAVMMFGLMGILGVDLNPANLIVLPLVLGIGVDDGVHVIHDFREQRGGKYQTSSSTINAIVLTSLTSMIGFGSMMIASHRGLYSVGLVLVIGVGSCMMVSLVMLPSLLTILSGSGKRRAEKENDGEESDSHSERKKMFKVAS